MITLSTRHHALRRALTTSHPDRAPVSPGLPARMLGRLVDDPSRPRATGTVGEWVRYVGAAVVVSLLGLVVAASFGLTTHTEVGAGSASSRLVVDGPDTTRAVPVGAAADTSLGGSIPSVAPLPEATSGTLDGYDRRVTGTSRQAVRDQLLKVAAAQQAAQRSRQLTRDDDQTRADAAAAAVAERAGTVSRQTDAATAEQSRLEEGRRRDEEAAALDALKRAAELYATGGVADSTGTARTASGSPQREPTVDVSGITGLGAVSPLPAGTYRVGAGFGSVGHWHSYHTGQDLSAPMGTPIRAVLPGVVVTDEANSWAGTHVSVRHADGSTTLYAHMSAKTVSPGDWVSAGTVIGFVGQTGRAFGNHLHFEYYPAGVEPGDVYHAVDPMPWLRALGVQL